MKIFRPVFFLSVFSPLMHQSALTAGTFIAVTATC